MNLNRLLRVGFVLVILGTAAIFGAVPVSQYVSSPELLTEAGRQAGDRLVLWGLILAGAGILILCAVYLLDEE